MGRKKKYHTEAERQAAAREAKRRSRAKKSGKGKDKPLFKTIADTLGGKVEEIAQAADAELKVPAAPKGGEPFANLPPLDLPSSGADASPSNDGTGDDAGTPTASADTSSSTGPSSGPSSTGSSETSKKTVKIDVSEIEAMLGPAVEQGVRAMGEYANANGFFALGEPFPRLARECACVIIRKRADEIGIDEEEYAAWLLGGIVGVNGVQAFRAYKKNAAAKQPVPKKESPRDVSPPPQERSVEQPASVREREGPANPPLAVKRLPEPDNRFQPASPSIV